MKTGLQLLGVVMWALLLADAAAAEPSEIFRSGDELIVQIKQLDQLRQLHPKLNATLRLTGADGDKVFTFDLADRLISAALVIDVAGYGAISAASLEVQDAAGKALLRQQVRPIPIVMPAEKIPLRAGEFAAIEAGSQLAPQAAPRIALPEVSLLRIQQFAAPSRAVNFSDITYPVITDADLPGSGSTNAIIVSRQTFAPEDPHQVSLYFSYRKPIYDDATLRLQEWRKMLIEVPLDRSWLEKQGDEVITLPLERFAIHTTEERERFGQRWNAADGYNMLGGSSAGLYQGGQTVDTDDEGRIYITNVADGAGIVRFNPRTGKFEQPPVNFHAEARKLIPPLAGWTRSWDADAAQVVCTRGRIFLVFDRNYRVDTPNGKFETCSGVISAPLGHWDDADAFRRDLRLHAACWPSAKNPLYADELAIGGTRRLGSPQATKHGITFGKFRLDLDSHGDTERLAGIKVISDVADLTGQPLPPTQIHTIQGLRKQRFINVGAAGRPFVKQSYSEFTISRAALALTLPGAPVDSLADATGRELLTFPGAPSGNLTIRFDITNKIKSAPQAYGVLAASMSGVSQGPAYAVIPVPGEADRAIGVCEYNYFFSKLDFSRRATERKVYKSYLTQSSNGHKTGFPLAVGLGPYNATWVEHDNALWLYMMGYTGMSRLKYAEADQPLKSFAVDVFHTRLKPQPIDGVARESVKDFLQIIPATDGRLIDIGRGRVGRGGGARSAGLELFNPRNLTQSQSAVEMNRCYGLFTPVSRMVYSTAGHAPRQEIYVASGNIRPEYVADIDDPDRRPLNQDPKIFAYDCASGSGLRDLYGFALPVLPGGRDSSSNLVLSPCSQYLVALQAGGTVLTYSIAQRRFVDGLQLHTPAGQPLKTLDFARPSASIWNAPNGQIFFHTAFKGDQSQSVEFYEVHVALEGQLSITPHLSVALEKVGRVRDFERIVRCFLPDLKRRDGSYDLILGSDTDNGGQPNVRVIEDFVAAARK